MFEHLRLSGFLGGNHWCCFVFCSCSKQIPILGKGFQVKSRSCDPHCLFSIKALSSPGVAYVESRPPGVPNGAYLLNALSCQQSCAANPWCLKFTWKRDTGGAQLRIMHTDAKTKASTDLSTFPTKTAFVAMVFQKGVEVR